MKKTLLFIFFFALTIAHTSAQNTAEDKEKLSRAIEYFNTEKYHEAGLLFRQLNEKYELSPRFKAYLAICEYQDWNYPVVTEIFDSIHTELTVYSPQEQNVYYNAAAESHFNIGNYKDAVKYYKLALKVCTNREKADLYYKIGISYLQIKHHKEARTNLMIAVNLYRKNPTGRDDRSRIKQIKKMLRGLL